MINQERSSLGPYMSIVSHLPFPFLSLANQHSVVLQLNGDLIKYVSLGAKAYLPGPLALRVFPLSNVYGLTEWHTLDDGCFASFSAEIFTKREYLTHHQRKYFLRRNSKISVGPSEQSSIIYRAYSKAAPVITQGRPRGSSPPDSRSSDRQ